MYGGARISSRTSVSGLVMNLVATLPSCCSSCENMSQDCCADSTLTMSVHPAWLQIPHNTCAALVLLLVPSLSVI